MKKTYKNTRKNVGSENNPQNLVNDFATPYGSAQNTLNTLLGLSYSPSNLDLMQVTRTGIKKQVLLNIANKLGITQEKLSSLLHINQRTLQRIQPTDALDVFSSEQTIEMARVIEAGMQCFSNPTDFQIWLNTPLAALNFNKPIDILDTSFGCNAVIIALNSLKHGVYA